MVTAAEIASRAPIYRQDYAQYSKAQRDRLCISAAALELVVRALVSEGRKVSAQACEELADALHAAALELGEKLYLPKSRRLQPLIKEVLNGALITEVVRPKREGNKHAAKYAGDEQMLALCTYLRCLPDNFTNTYIARLVPRLAERWGWRVPSERWVLSQLGSREMRFAQAATRWNEGARFGSAYNVYLPAAGAAFADDCWQADGTRVNIAPFRNPTATGPKEKYLYIIAVRDVASGAVIGMHLDMKEDRFGWMAALSSAAENTGRLPHTLQLDHFPGHNTPEFQSIFGHLKSVGVRVELTSVATGKARIERFFSTLQTVFMQSSAYYYGEGIKSTHAYAHRSESYLKKLSKLAKAEGWDMEAAIANACGIVEAYNVTPYAAYSRKYKAIGESPAQLYEQSEKPHGIALKPWQMALLFMPQTVATFKNGLIRIEVRGEERLYRIAEERFVIDYTNTRLVVKYHVDQADKIWLFDQDGNYIREVERFDRVGVYGPNLEGARLGKAVSDSKLIKQAQRAISQRSEVELERAGLSTEAIRAELYAKPSNELKEADDLLLLQPHANKHLKEDTESDLLSNFWNS